MSLTGEQRRAFCAFAKIPTQFTRRGGLLRPRVRDSQQHIGVTRLVERAPAGEIFAAQTVANIALAEIISEVLLV